MREMRSIGVKNKDIEKKKKWMMKNEGEEEVIDLKIERVNRSRGEIYRMMEYEDLRKIIKKKRELEKEIMKKKEKRIMERRQMKQRIWMEKGKKV